MFWFILILTLLISVALIVMVLLQPSKGGGMTSAFGSLGTSLGSTFGSRRTLDFLAKGTAWAAGILAVLSLIANMFMIPHADTGVVNPKTDAVPVPASPAPSLPGGNAAPAPPAGGAAPAQSGQTQTPPAGK